MGKGQNDASVDDVLKMMKTFNESNSQNLTNLWAIADAGIVALALWNVPAEVVAVTTRNFVKKQYSPDSDEFKAIKLLGNLSLAIYHSLRKQINQANAHNKYLEIGHVYTTTVNIHLNEFEDLISMINSETVTYGYYSRVCKITHNPLTIIRNLHKLMVTNCYQDDFIEESTNTDSKSYKLATEFFDRLEADEPGLKTSIFKNHKNRIIMALSNQYITKTNEILNRLKYDLKNKSITDIWNIVGKMALEFTKTNIGICLPQEIIRLSQYKFYMVSGVFAQISKELIDVCIAAIHCLDEIANGDFRQRKDLLQQMQKRVKEIFEISKVFVRNLLIEFTEYKTLISAVREYLDQNFKGESIPISKYNERAVNIQRFLEIRGFDELFYQVIITENKIYGREVEMFSSNNVTKPSYVIPDYGKTHIFINRYNATVVADTHLRARKAREYISDKTKNITKVIKANFDEVFICNIYAEIEKVAPDVISDNLYTGLLILSEWDITSAFIRHGMAVNSITGTEYYSIIYNEYPDGFKTYYHKLIFLL